MSSIKNSTMSSVQNISLSVFKDGTFLVISNVSMTCIEKRRLCSYTTIMCSVEDFCMCTIHNSSSMVTSYKTPVRSNITVYSTTSFYRPRFVTS